MATTNAGVKTILYPVSDMAKVLYGSLLGNEPYDDQPYYVDWKVDGQDIGLVPQGNRQGITVPVAYHHVDDINGTIATLVNAGAEAQAEPRDVGGGRLVAALKDADGNVIGLIQDPV